MSFFKSDSGLDYQNMYMYIFNWC